MGAPSTPPWMQPPPGIYSMGSWGDGSQGWQTYGQPGVRQISSLGNKFTPTSTSNRYDALSNKASDTTDVEPSQTSTKPIMYDKIVWKDDGGRMKRGKNVNSTSEDYLFNGKTFSLDKYVKMQGKDVGGGVNSGINISASRTTGTEDFDKRFPKLPVTCPRHCRKTCCSIRLSMTLICAKVHST